jgi:prophage antirepressor-like protein
MCELLTTIIGTFIFEDGKSSIRVLGSHEEPLFVVNDLCEILGIKNSRDRMMELPKECKSHAGVYNGRRIQKTNVVTEAGMYYIILRSNKPNASKFQQWVCKTVLPSIRKTGSYHLDDDRKQLMEENKKHLSYIKELEANLVKYIDIEQFGAHQEGGLAYYYM